jgi:hypothetical protein
MLHINDNGDSIRALTIGRVGIDRGITLFEYPTGGILLAGYTYSVGAGLGDIWLVRFNAQYIIQWERLYGGPGLETVSGLVRASNGGFMILGNTTSYGAGTPQYSNGYALRINSSGDSLSSRVFGGIFHDSFQGTSATMDGGCIIAGASHANALDHANAWFIRLAPLASLDSDEPDISHIPREFELLQNYPNPFNATTTIPFSIARSARVQLIVYDILGRKVTTLADEIMSAGAHARVFDGSAFASGVYLYRLEAGDELKMGKMVLLK